MKQDLDLYPPEAPAPFEVKQPSVFRRYAWAWIALAAIALFLVARSRRSANPAAPAAGGAAAAKIVIPPTPVQLGVVKTGTVTETVEVSGNIAALTEVTLSSKIPARVTGVNAREGDTVRRGQVLVTLDTSDLDSQVRSAQAALASAEATVRQQRAAVGAAEAKLMQNRDTVHLQEATSKTAVQTAQEQLRSAQAALEQGRNGARAQERLEAQAAVNVAQANLDNAQSNYNRTQRLVQEGAYAPAQLDTAEMQLKVSQAQLESARQQQSLVLAGTRPEQLTQMEAAVQQSKQGLQQAQDNLRQIAIKWQDVRSQEATVKQMMAQVASGEANVRQAQAQVALARQNRDNAFLRSSVSGIVTKRNVEPGQTATVGSPLMSIMVPGTVYFSAALSERDLGKVRAGQTAIAVVDAFPNRRFTGKVDRIYPSGDPSSRTFEARITLADGGRLRPGMFAKGVIVTASRPNRVLVPKAALSVAGSPIPIAGSAVEGAAASVFVIRDGQVARKPIRIGAPSDESVEVVSGLQPGDKVIVSGSGLDEGQKVIVAGSGAGGGQGDDGTH